MIAIYVMFVIGGRRSAEPAARSMFFVVVFVFCVFVFVVVKTHTQSQARLRVQARRQNFENAERQKNRIDAA